MSETDVLINADATNSNSYSEGQQQRESKKDNSPAVIFSLWSTMMGSTVLVMPRLFRDAGLIPSIISTILMSLLCCYTAVLMTRVGRHYGASVTDVLKSLPTTAKISTLITSILVFAGVCMIIHLYMAQSVMHYLGEPMTSHTDRIIVASAIGGVVFLISLLKKLGPLFAASSYCIVILVFCSVFILVKAVLQLRNKECTPKLAEEYGLGWQGLGPVAALMAVMCVSFFCHNFVLQILTQATRPEKTERNVFFAFMCTAATYVVPSATAVVAFSKCKELSADFISMFDDVYSDVARGAVIILVGVVYPVVVFIARTQVLDAVFGTVEVFDVKKEEGGDFSEGDDAAGDEEEGPTKTKVEQAPHPYWAHLLFNLFYLAATTLPSLLNASLVVVSAAVGVFGTYWALLLPSVLYMRMKHHLGQSSAGLLISHGGIVLIAIALMVTTILTVVGVIPSGAPLPATVSISNVTTHSHKK